MFSRRTLAVGMKETGNCILAVYALHTLDELWQMDILFLLY